MNEDIQLLFATYEQELAALQFEIEEAQIHGDYETVYLLNKAILNTRHQIYILNLIADPNWREKQHLEQIIEVYSKRLNYPDELKAKLLAPSINKLLELNTLQSNHYFNDGQDFDDAIYDLVDGKTLSSTFYLRKADQLYLHFSIKKEKINIRITSFAKLPSKDYFSKPTIRHLRRIGFTKNKSKKYYHLKYPQEDFKNAMQIKAIVSRIIYEVLYNYDLDRETTLIIQANPNF
ncbi:hypothetical protein [Pedobacter sandarakinus]|uniref:hypothetical protein n=1 Tax=Pedobacter sandarakinus TaxID=353156 RepID=UPI002247A30D|nr:hypothetical protein [Pedobacter sandarakinus]MCX2573959.1 hypothetical protein [Pedobacter sandarakinus]